MTRCLPLVLAAGVAHAAGKVPAQGEPPKNTCYVDFIDIATGLGVLIRCKDRNERVLNVIFDGGSSDALTGPLRRKYRFGYILGNDKGLKFPEGSVVHHLFQSHAHFDHHSELTRKDGIVEKYDVKNVWDPAMLNKSVEYGCFMQSVVDKANERKLIYHPAKDCPDLDKLDCDGAKIRKFKSSSYYKPFTTLSVDDPTATPYAMNFGGVDGITARILHANPNLTGKDHNKSSLVVMFDLFGVKLLLTGDEEADVVKKSVEKLLIDAKIDLKAHIVQVAHHGSDTSSTQPFVDAVVIAGARGADTYAVISSGKIEYSGVELPRDDIVARWEKAVGRGRLLSTKLYDDPHPARPLCDKHPDKIAPMPATDDSTAGCNNIQFTIKKGPGGRGFIDSVLYWPLGPRIY
jgi:hypothetical protein